MISEKQRAILKALSERSMSRKELQPLVGIYGSEMTNLITLLHKSEFVCSEYFGRTRLMSVTDLGMSAMRGKVSKHVGNLARPNEINMFLLPVYSPSQHNSARVGLAYRGF